MMAQGLTTFAKVAVSFAMDHARILGIELVLACSASAVNSFFYSWQNKMFVVCCSWRFMRRNIETPRISLSCKLVPVLYRE